MPAMPAIPCPDRRSVLGVLAARREITSTLPDELEEESRAKSQRRQERECNYEFFASCRFEVEDFATDKISN